MSSLEDHKKLSIQQDFGSIRTDNYLISSLNDVRNVKGKKYERS